MEYEHLIIVVLSLYFGFLALALTYLSTGMLLILAIHPGLPKRLHKVLGGHRDVQRG